MLSRASEYPRTRAFYSTQNFYLHEIVLFVFFFLSLIDFTTEDFYYIKIMGE